MPIIVISGYLSDQAGKVILAGFAEFLPKPFSLQLWWVLFNVCSGILSYTERRYRNTNATVRGACLVRDLAVQEETD
jgi:hypothetical protein